MLGDDDEAARPCSRSSTRIPDLRAFDGGSLENAVGMETFAAVLLTVNIRHKGEGQRSGIDGRRSHRMRMTIRLYDTARRAVVPFEPPPVVRMYVCGITPYDSTHLGHAATYLTYDLLIRRLEELGHEVRMVRNITDVDDSILPKARELGVPYLELAEAEIARFHSRHGRARACARRSPSRARPSRSTRIIELVGRLLDSGHAYLTHGTVYFDVSTFPRFGELSHYSRRPDGASSPARAAATPTIRTAATRSTSCCGSRRSPTSPRGARRSASAGPAGTSSARRWRCTSSARRSTCTAAAPTSSSRTTSARSRRARALTGEPFVAPLAALGDGELRGREDVEVARQPRVRRATC